MNNPTVVYKDESYAILICKDGLDKLVVQLVSYVPRQLTNSENELEEHLSAKVIASQSVTTHSSQQVNQHLKIQLGEAISQMQKQLALYRHVDEHIEGALKDYVGTPR